MKYFFDHLNEIIDRIATAAHVAYFSDYDGTLVPIVRSPDLAQLSLETKNLFIQLAEIPSISAGIVSGRGLSDIQMHVGISNIYYVGSHGLEIAMPDGTVKPTSLDLNTTLALDEIRKKIKILQKEFDGIFVEDKGACLAVHYRNVIPLSTPAIDEAVRTIEAEHVPHVILKSGKKVWEFVPNINVTKGTAIEDIYRTLPNQTLLVYAGDDRTDEDAFEVVRCLNGVTIHVGSSIHSLAEYFINEAVDINSVLSFFGKESTYGH